jgi:O-antigen/teichoic acid export membrane protein
VLLGFPLAMAHISGWTTEMIGKLMINNMIGVDATGLYSVGYRFGMIMLMVQAALSRAWLPFFFENINNDSPASRMKLVRATYACIAGLLVLALLIGFSGPYLLHLMVVPKFYAASQFIFLVTMAYFCDGVWKLFLGYLTHRDRTRLYSSIVFAAAITNVVLNYVLLKKIGLIGAAWSIFISYAIGALLTIVAAARSHPMPWLSIDVVKFLRAKPASV